MRPNLSTDSLSSYFDSRIVLADSAAAAAAMRSTHSGDDGMEPLEGLDSAALGRLLPDLDASDPDPVAGPSGRASSTEHGAPASQGRPMRRRIGSVEDDIFSAVGGLELGHDIHDLDGEGSGSAAAAAALGDHMLGEAPSRTLFVRNVEADVADEEIRALFQVGGVCAVASSMTSTAMQMRGMWLAGLQCMTTRGRFCLACSPTQHILSSQVTCQDPSVIYD